MKKNTLLIQTCDFISVTEIFEIDKTSLKVITVYRELRLIKKKDKIVIFLLKKKHILTHVIFLLCQNNSNSTSSFV